MHFTYRSLFVYMVRHFCLTQMCQTYKKGDLYIYVGDQYKKRLMFMCQIHINVDVFLYV